MGCVGSTCLQGDYTSIPDTHQNTTDVPVMRLCAPGKDSTYFADVGDTVVLYVDFGPNCSPCPLNDIGDTVDNVEAMRMAAAAATPGSSGDGHQERFNYEVMMAGVLVELTCLHPAVRDSKNYKASVKIPTERTAGILLNGHCIPVRLPYHVTIGADSSEDRFEYREMTQEAITSERDTVFFQSIWRNLKDHNLKNIRQSVSRETSLLGRYGSLGRTSPIVGAQDLRDGSSDNQSSLEQQDVIVEGQRRERIRAKRYWPDSWQMKFWRRAGCDKIIRSKNPIARFIALFFVAPLVNVTGLSLHYQLYLSEIFHTRFWTRLLHYLCMPFIVLMMMAFFAQWRFVIDTNDSDNCYRTGNVEVMVLNGSMALGLALWFWYLIWGACQQTLLMGIFMIVPLFILYLLANIFFQVSIKNSLKNYPCTACWKHTNHSDGHIQYYKIFELVNWYYNPVIWAVVFSFMQALSHMFEPKIPPRVSQTAHWMSCSQMLKRSGYTRTLCILLAQAIFGTVDEFLASPRLLPIFVLRVCYELGYHKKQWKWMKKLVKRCLQYGDPALDYIGTGGAEYLENTTVFKNVNVDTLKAELDSMKLALTDHQKQLLENPSLFREFKESGRTDNFLTHYIVLRHYVAQYILQVYAYGPFRSRGDEHHAHWDGQRMERDFGDNHSFRNFLDQVRDSLWQMEDDMLEKRSGSPCCRDVEEV